MDKDFNLTKTEAKKLLLIKKGYIHTFLNNPNFGLVGADRSKKSVLDDIDKAERLNLAGESVQSMGHALAIIKPGAEYQSDILFVETKSDEVNKLLEQRK